MDFYAHTENPNGNWHKLADHLSGVGALAADFAAQMNPELVEAAHWAGLLHDFGKYRDEFQEYLRGERSGGVDTHHAVYGAALARKRGWVSLAYAIAGHHAGLYDFEKLREYVRKPAYTMDTSLPALEERFRSELGSLPAKVSEPQFVGKNLQTDLYVRMVFSALVDADFLDTESHYQAATRSRVRGLNETKQARDLLTKLNAAKKQKADDAKADGKDAEVIALRNAIYEQCLSSGEKEQGFFSLTVPTGGGKTLSGMAFALSHALKHNLQRVIVVIPYLSIIEQNSAEYRRILDPNREGIIIENHSAVSIPSEDDEGKEDQTTEARERSPLVLAAENWDAPIVVTTSVQFIESLFSNKPSRCRKLHNMASSVVLFDEVQTLPVHLLEPLLSMFRELQKSYGVSFVFSTATQPAFRKQVNLPNGFEKEEVVEITQDTEATFKQLRRVRFELPKANEKRTWPDIASEMRMCEQVLCVVNTRKQAFALWQQLCDQLAEDKREGLFHLSSAMCAEHRLFAIGEMNKPREGSIRWRLRHSKPCRVVSTQLVEAGVDLDFPVLYRAIGPLDSIVQAAGRCNRESRLPQFGRVIVFNPEDESLPPGIYKTATQETATLLSRTPEERLATDPQLFGDYFKRIYGKAATDYARRGETTIQQDRQALNFRTVAGKVRVIDENGVAVIVPFGGDKGRAMEIVEEIRARQPPKGAPRFTREDLRKLQRFMVNVRENDFQKLQYKKQVWPLLPNSKAELYVLNIASYHDRLGVLISDRPTNEYIL